MQILPADKIQAICEPITKDILEVYKIAQKMSILCRSSKGIGLSAVQVGIPWKMFIILNDNSLDKFDCYLNCEYEALSEEKIDSIEGCLSIKNKHFLVSRYKKIRVFGEKLVDLQTISFSVDIEATDDHNAIVFQHEIDHHRNILISDVGKEISLYAS